MSSALEITPTSVVSQSSSQVGCELDDEMVMMHIDTGEYFGCDQIGSRVWRLIEQPRSVAELCDMLVQEFDVQRDQCEQDVVGFLSELATESLVDVTSASAA